MKKVDEIKANKGEKFCIVKYSDGSIKTFNMTLAEAGRKLASMGYKVAG